MSCQRNSDIYRGQDWTANFSPSLQQIATGDISISGWTLVFYLSDKPGDTVLLTVNCTILNASAGTYTVTLTAEQTASLDKGKYNWQVWRTNSGSTYPIVGNEIKVLEGVYQPA